MRTEITKPLTAAQIAKGKNLPPRLVNIGREVEAKVSKYRTYEAKASDIQPCQSGSYSLRQQPTSIKGGFNAFPQKILSVARQVARV